MEFPPVRRFPRNLVCLLLVAGATAGEESLPEFADIAEALGIKAPMVAEQAGRKDFLWETTGSGVAIFDFDCNGRNDAFLANGTRLGAKEHPRPALYRNQGSGKFRDVAAET